MNKHTRKNLDGQQKKNRVFSHGSLTSASIARLCVFLAPICKPSVSQINPAMNGLSLEQNQIGDEGVAHNAEALRTETSLTFVNFQGNQARGRVAI